MPVRIDKLGRRIPQFDRVQAGRKSAKTAKEKHGNDVHRRNGALGARMRTRGHFGKLKDEGKDAEIKSLAQQGAKASPRTKPGKRKTTVRGRKVQDKDS